jgi:thioredoxin-related protein
MKLMIRTYAALVALNCSGFAFAGGEGWTSDFAAAKKEAAESKKDLLIDFTGSDWCGWCIKLNKEVFSHEPFKTGVKDKFVLVELDYPKDKSKLSAETIKQNGELKKKYAIQGYPTILLADAEGRPIAKTGYQGGGPEAYVKHLDKLRAMKTARDESFAAAAKASGVDKAKALIAAFAAMGLNENLVLEFYGDVVAQIKAADPNDETGFAKAAAAKARLASFKNELDVLAKGKDFDGALALVDKTLKEGGFSTEENQQMMMSRAMIFAQQKKFDEALKTLDEAKALAPGSMTAARIDVLKTRLEAGKKQAEDAK